MDQFRIDSQKLIYHIPTLYRWLQGENIYPIYIEVGLSDECNHKCIFCAFDFCHSHKNVLSLEFLKKFIKTAAYKGVKSILYSGEGEPLINKEALSIIAFTRKVGIDIALSTNGVLLDKEKSKILLKTLTWIRISLDAGTNSTYALVHGTSPNDFNVVLNNVGTAAKIKKDNKYACTIGVQFLLLPQNYKEVTLLARILQDIGVDYLAIKPYSPHPLSHSKLNIDFKYEDLFYLEDDLKKYSKENFQIIFRRNAMNKLSKNKPYQYCLALPFAAHITAKGEVYPCNIFVGREEYSFGNICQESFQSIWEGSRRRKIMDRIRTEWDINSCRKSCRLDEINQYLWEIKHPIKHVNFI